MANHQSPSRSQPREPHRAPFTQQNEGSVARSLLIKEFGRAKRNRSLFMLDGHARGFVYLALRLKVRFESFDLIRAAVSVLKQLKELGDEAYNRLMEGMRLAWVYSQAAVGWGNCAARSWRNDRAYAEYLGRFGPGGAVRQ